MLIVERRRYHASRRGQPLHPICPEAFAADPDRLARFEREAKVLASLNHPNIGHIYGLEEADAVRELFLEYIDGPAADATDQVRA